MTRKSKWKIHNKGVLRLTTMTVVEVRMMAVVLQRNKTKMTNTTRETRRRRRKKANPVSHVVMTQCAKSYRPSKRWYNASQGYLNPWKRLRP